MSRLSNIKETYGKQIGISIANTNGENVLASTLLPKNNIIIASPVNADANDIGTYAMFMTDNEGTPVRLTYVIEPGNGLNIDTNNTDIIKLDIDNRSIRTNDNGELIVATGSLVDGISLTTNENGQFVVCAQNLPIASKEEYGVVGIDEQTIKTNTLGKIYVDTSGLDKANNTQTGIVQPDNKTILINSNGVVSVNTNNLKHATSEIAGVIQCDGHTLVQTENDGLEVKTHNLKYTTVDSYGISKCDGSTILAKNGVYSVNTEGLTKCSTTSKGVVKTDNASTITKNGNLSVNNYTNIVDRLNDLQSRILTAEKEIEKLNSISSNAITKITSPTIFTFMCNAVTSVNLTKSKYGTFPEDMISETITAEFTVNTNCPFIITITYMDNLAPSIYLYEINYDDIDNYPGEVGLYNEFQSTGYADKILRFSWKCKNYSASTGGESTPTRIKITVSYPGDNTVSQTVYYNIVRYNSLFKKSKVGPTILTADTTGKLKIDNTITITGNKRKQTIS